MVTGSSSKGGIEVCIDQRMKRMAKITLTVNNETYLKLHRRTTQRQGSAMTEIMSQEAFQAMAMR